MKTTVLVMVLLCVVAIAVSAQQSADLYAVNYQIIRVLESPFGYRVVLRAADFSEQDFYVPTRWILQDKVALVSFTASPAAPYLQVYYDGSDQIQFFRLALPRNPEHASWVYDAAGDLAEQFERASLGSGL